MKRKTTILVTAVICLAGILIAYYLNNSAFVKANEKASPIKITARSINSDSKYLTTQIKIPVISLPENIEIQNKINSKFENDALKEKVQLEKQAQEGFKDAEKFKYPFNKYQIYIDYKVTCNINNILSIPLTCYEYTGGAHGMTAMVTSNLNLNTGNEIKLKDLFNHGYNYTSTIKKEVIKSINKEPDYYFPEAVKTIQNYKTEPSFYLQDGNIVIYYGLYDIAPYAAGIREFKLPAALFNGAVKKDYLCK